jgi:uncharacterized membrane protein YbhN (UPF0104 family)
MTRNRSPVAGAGAAGERDPAGSSRPSLLRFWLRLGAGVLLLGFILSRVDLSALARSWGPRSALGVAGAALLLLAGQSVAALRWKLILGAGSPPWTYLVRLYVIGGFFSLFLPTVVGGDLVRAAAAARGSGRAGGVVASVLLDRSLGVLAMAGYAVLGILLAPDPASRLGSGLRFRFSTGAVLAGLGLLLVAGLAAALFVRRSARLRQAARDALAVAGGLARSPRLLVQAVALGFVVQGLYIVLWLVLARSTALPLPGLTLLVAVPIVTLAAMLPVTLGGLGVREGAWLLLLGGSGIPPEQTLAFSLLFFATNLVTGLVGGLVFVLAGTGLRDADPGR